MLRYMLAFVVLALLFTACAVNPGLLPVQNMDDRQFIATVWGDSLSFSLPDDEKAELAWHRAEVFVARFGSPISHSYKYAITCYPVTITSTTATYRDVSYIVTRIKESNRVYFSISGVSVGKRITGRLNSYMLAHYMKTGELKEHLLNADLEITNIIANR